MFAEQLFPSVTVTEYAPGNTLMISSEVALYEAPSDQANVKFPSPPETEILIAPVLSPKQATLVELDKAITGFEFSTTAIAFAPGVVAIQPVLELVTSNVYEPDTVAR